MSRGFDDPTHVLQRLPRVECAAVDVVVVRGAEVGKRWRAAPGRTRIGSSPRCELRLDDPAVSRLHCELHVEPNGVRIVDCHSSNGTWVNGTEVGEAKLTSGSSLTVGTTQLTLEFGARGVVVPLSPRERFGSLLGSSSEMRRLYAMIEGVAPTESSVLIQGETGTGKELVARAIHDASRRAKGPLVAVDCGAIAESLVESELFGHKRGAFSGASSDRRGLFEEANGGTVFLDEIGDLPLALQPKLLRALEARQVRRVGDNVVRPVDIRLLAATHRSLAESVNRGTFREDLYYRLAVVELRVPPLRNRREDVPMLAAHFRAQAGGGPWVMTAEEAEHLMNRSWPGNVRELRNFVERSLCFGWAQDQPSTRTPESPGVDATPQVSRPSPHALLESMVPVDLPLKEARERWTAQMEGVYLTALLRRTGGNVTRAAELAGVNRRYFHRMMAALGISSLRASGDGPSDELQDDP